MKLFKILFLFALSINLFAVDVFTGDKRTACEVILCLSSSTKPQECNAPIKKFFSIKAKKWWKTLELRRNFLNLCPTGDNGIDNDKIMADLKEAIVNIPHECTPEVLNKTYEYTYKTVSYPDMCNEQKVKQVMRITKSIPRNCLNLINNAYTNLKLPINTCSNDFYRTSDFYRGYYESVAFTDVFRFNHFRKNKNDIDKTNLTKYVCQAHNSEKINSYTIYAQKHEINKKCWRYQ